MTRPVCIGCGESCDGDAPRLCEPCEIAMDIAEEHSPDCECAACQLWVKAALACSALGLTLEEVRLRQWL